MQNSTGIDPRQVTSMRISRSRSRSPCFHDQVGRDFERCLVRWRSRYCCGDCFQRSGSSLQSDLRLSRGSSETGRICDHGSKTPCRVPIGISAVDLSPSKRSRCWYRTSFGHHVCGQLLERVESGRVLELQCARIGRSSRSSNEYGRTRGKNKSKETREQHSECLSCGGSSRCCCLVVDCCLVADCSQVDDDEETTCTREVKNYIYSRLPAPKSLSLQESSCCQCD